MASRFTPRRWGSKLRPFCVQLCATSLGLSLSAATLPAQPTPVAGVAADAAAGLTAGKAALLHGRADEAIADLHAVLAANPANSPIDGQAHLLLCRVYYSEELPDAAVPECEAALATLSNDSSAQDWMGRAYGLQADRSGPLDGLKLAPRVRAAFEAAVSLDPGNGEAVNDLGEYYVGAPMLLGGGLDKANALADRVQARLPQQADRIRGYIAVSRHDYGTAERQFRNAVSVAGRPNAWADLGDFYAKHGNKDQAVQTLHHALDVDQAHDATLVDVASILIHIKQQPYLAGDALRAYLSSPNQTDAGPVFKARVMLGKLMEDVGDKNGARTQFQQALALAHDYVPAQKALQHLG